MITKFAVSGNIIGELSEKIPSNIIALNELIKNSYDAGAKNIEISLNTKQNKLVIKDDGDGMNSEDIKTLLHISKSNKMYGKVNKHGRITQGSKGLGFLSVFKFGKKVTWRTKKDIGYEFSLEREVLTNSENLLNEKVEIKENNKIEKGTEIEIEIVDNYQLSYLKNYLTEEINYLKIINSFDTQVPKIQIYIDNHELIDNTFSSLEDYNIERQLFYVLYDSKEQKLKFYHNKNLVLSKKYEFNSEEFDLELELSIFQFKSRGRSEITPLFSNNLGDLTPLIYINSNLFNNYEIFDPGIMKNIRSSQVLNQMIGYVKIKSSNKELDFNSDRTHFLENKFTNEIKSYLKEINKEIQILGSLRKKYLINFDILKEEVIEDFLKAKDNIKDDFYFKNDVKITRINDEIKYSLFGKEKIIKLLQTKLVEKTYSTFINKVKEIESKNNIPLNVKEINNKEIITPKEAYIDLSEEVAKYKIPSQQIDLKEFVKSAKDSNGKDIPLEKIKIKVDEKELAHSILESQNNEGEKKVVFSYEDKETGKVINGLKLVFHKEVHPIKVKKRNVGIFELPTKESYRIRYDESTENLILQLQKLNIEDYLEIYAACLRILFELGVYKIKNSVKTNLPEIKSMKHIEESVKEIIEFASGKEIREKIAKSTGMTFDDLKNSLTAEKFKESVSQSNLGSHKGTKLLTKQAIEEIAQKAVLFNVVVNELLMNDEI